MNKKVSILAGTTFLVCSLALGMGKVSVKADTISNQESTSITASLSSSSSETTNNIVEKVTEDTQASGTTATETVKVVDNSDDSKENIVKQEAQASTSLTSSSNVQSSSVDTDNEAKQSSTDGQQKVTSLATISDVNVSARRMAPRVLATNRVAVTKLGWNKQYGSYYYLMANGKKLTSSDAHSNGWVYVNMVPYQFDSDGRLLTNTRVNVQGKYYYLDNDGHYYNKGWLGKDYSQHYYKKDGSEVTSADANKNGWVYIDGAPYIFSDDGYLRINARINVQGKYYYLDNDGHYYNKGWLGKDYSQHYYKKDGSEVTSADANKNGWVYIGGAPYIFSDDGYLQIDTTVAVRGKYYYLDNDGHYYNKGWFGSKYSRRYYKKDGSAVTSADADRSGWVYLDKKAYLFDEDGYLITDRQVMVHNRYYYVDENGNYVRNQWIGTDYYGSNGALVG